MAFAAVKSWFKNKFILKRELVLQQLVQLVSFIFMIIYEMNSAEFD